jgi:cation transport protein ChaC
LDRHVLTRELIAAGGIDAMVARDAPDIRLLTEAERAASVRATLAAGPDTPVWLFGYGSLIWNPTVHFVEQRAARIQGWHRRFCLSTRAGRGTLENPGLVLGLDQGGLCEGVAFRLADETVEAELTLLWRREMLSNAYVPTWVDLLDPAGGCFGQAVTFTINRDGPHYAGDLTLIEVVQRLATASGALGSAADYLFRTCEGLRAFGIPDAELERLAEAVAVAQREAGGPGPKDV